MATDVTTIRLPAKDLMMIEHFVKDGEFKSKSELIRYAVKKTIFEMLLKEFHEKLGSKELPDKKQIEELLDEIKTIRRKQWKTYAKRLP